jgi:hypothetical protein
VEYKNGTISTLFPMKQFDKRLLASKYYQRRKPDYDTMRYSREWNTGILSVGEVDIVLTQDEQDRVDGLINNHFVKRWGFADVCIIFSSLDWC